MLQPGYSCLFSATAEFEHQTGVYEALKGDKHKVTGKVATYGQYIRGVTFCKSRVVWTRFAGEAWAGFFACY